MDTRVLIIIFILTLACSTLIILWCALAIADRYDEEIEKANEEMECRIELAKALRRLAQVEQHNEEQIGNIMKNWKTMIDEALEENGEGWGDVQENTMSESDMEKEFDDGFGGIEGCAFTVWTKRGVYFPVCYEGAEWVGRVSRNPDGKPTKHIGSGI